MSEMQEKKKTELNLYLMLKTLLRRGKYLLLSLLIGAVIGGSLGFFLTFSKKVYGAEIQFQVYQVNVETPTNNTNGATVSVTKPNAYKRFDEATMSDLLSFLNARSFMERLYCDEYGVPVAKDNYADDLKSAIESARTQKKDLKEKEVSVKLLETEVEKEKSITEMKKELYTIEDETFEAMTTAYEIAVTAGTLTPAQEEEYQTQKEIYLNAYTAYTAQQRKQAQVQEQYAVLQAEASAMRTQTNEAVAKALSLWRMEEDYKNLFRKVDKANVEFTRPVGNDSLAFITANIGVNKDLSFAKELVLLVEKTLPSYVKECIGDSAFCQALPYDAVGRTDMDDVISSTVTYALLVGFLMVIVAGVVFAWKHKEEFFVYVESEN